MERPVVPRLPLASAPSPTGKPLSLKESRSARGPSPKRFRNTGFRTERYKVRVKQVNQDQSPSPGTSLPQLQPEPQAATASAETHMNRMSLLLGGAASPRFLGVGTRPVLSTWPAQAETKGPNEKQKQGGEYLQGSKPIFLVKLEEFLDKRLAEVEGDEMSEAAILAHHDTFRLLIDGFRTYKPVLARIFRCYDSLLDQTRAHQSAVDKANTLVATMQNECTHRLKLHKANFKTQREALEADAAKLKEQVLSLQSRLEEQIQAKKQAVADMESMHLRAETAEQRNKAFASGYKYLMQTLANKESETEEPLELVTLMHKLETMQHENNQMSARMSNLYTPEEFLSAQQDLVKERNELRKTNETMEQNVADMKADLASAVDERGIHKTQAEELSVTLEKMRHEMTPKPAVEGREEVLRAVGVNPDTDHTAEVHDKLVDAVNRLLSEAGKPLPSDPEAEFNVSHYTALGKSSALPQFLRASGQVLNRRLTKAELDKLLRDVWEAKGRYDRDRPSRSTLSEYVYVFFRERLSQSMISEWGLNLIRSLDRYSADPSVDMFGRVLLGLASEDIRTDFNGVVANLRNSLSTAERQIQHDDPTADLPLKDILRIMRSNFPIKKDEDMLRLEEVASVMYRNKFTRASSLFDDPDGRKKNSGPLVDELRRQYLLEMEEYWIELHTELHKVALANAEAASAPTTDGDEAPPRDHTKDMVVSIWDLRQVLKEIEPDKPSAEIVSLCARSFDMPHDEMVALIQRDKAAEQRLLAVPLELVSQRLRRGVVRRQSARPPTPPAAAPEAEAAGGEGEGEPASAAEATEPETGETTTASGDKEEGGETSAVAQGAVEEAADSKTAIKQLRAKREQQRTGTFTLELQNRIAAAAAAASAAAAAAASAHTVAKDDVAKALPTRELREGPRRFLTASDDTPRMLHVPGDNKDQPIEETT